MKITVEMLKAKKACDEQIELFEETFGAEAEVTFENCLKAQKTELDLYWAARNLLTAPATDAYYAAIAPALAALEAAIAQAFFDACQIEETR